MPYASEVRILTGVTIMTIEELRAEYATYNAGRAEWGCTAGASASMVQIMRAVPVMLDVLEAAVAWHDSGCASLEESQLIGAIHDFND